MRDYDRIFKPEESREPREAIVAGALKCLEDFGDRFTAEDLDGMDDCLHFPHYLLSGSELIEWKTRARLPKNFFEALRAQGWDRTVTQKREVVLVSPDKVHFKVRYNRERKDGTVISEHENLWIVVFRENRWGILLRSY